MIVAFAGRRVDADTAPTPRFPLSRAGIVLGAIRDTFAAYRATGIVSSAACGADLLALRAAAELGMRRRIVLPFERQRFLTTSVTDRAGPWARLFAAAVDAAERTGDLAVLADSGQGANAYARANQRIVDEALRLAAQEEGAVGDPAQRALAVIAWDGVIREGGDLVWDLAERARAQGIPVVSVSTLAL